MSILPGLNNIAAQLDAARRVHAAIGAALTEPQQIAVSAKIVKGMDAFIAWTQTDKGRQALREMADKFVEGA